MDLIEGERLSSIFFSSRSIRVTDLIPVDGTEVDLGDFTLYFLAFDHSGGKATDAEKKADRRNREGKQLSTATRRVLPAAFFTGILELTHNHGTETLEATPYHSGNDEPKGYGHIAITVANVEEACARFERLGVPFKKRLTDGKMKFLAFILDPDGYWIEVVRVLPRALPL
jgi:lactoylglutathione lyase